MISIGNDIISLNHIHAQRTVQEKFYSKFLNDVEVELFNNNQLKISFENFIWLIWSIKESVYKFYKRHNQQDAFSPTKIIIKKILEPICKTSMHYMQHENISFNKNECFCCTAIFNNMVFYSRSFINNNCIFTVANNKDCFKNIYWGIQQINNDSYCSQSALVRTFVLKKLREQFSNKNFEIKKATAGYPYLKNKQDIILSFTHHGNFVGYSFLLDQ